MLFKCRLLNVGHISAQRGLRSLFQVLPLLDSIVVSIPACHAGDRGSIPRRGAFGCEGTKKQNW